VEALRNRQVKNFITLLLTSVGAPLIQMGDEVRRTQRGNNNAYCQDNDISWFDWALLDKHADVHRFVKQLIANRLGAGSGRTDQDTLLDILHRAQVDWHGVDFGPLDTGDGSHALALSRKSPDDSKHFYLMINAYWEPLDFVLPPSTAETKLGWRRAIDTSLPSPDDICAWAGAPPVTGHSYQVGPRSVVALVATAG
jgi:glycogen operon protein